MATPIVRLVRQLVERVASRFYEAEDPPARLAQFVDDFAMLHPRATRQQWCDMAKALADGSYRAGYQRGYERSERAPGADLPATPPELVADSMDLGWWRNPPMGEAAEGLVAEEEIEPGEVVPREEPE